METSNAMKTLIIVNSEAIYLGELIEKIEHLNVAHQLYIKTVTGHYAKFPSYHIELSNLTLVYYSHFKVGLMHTFIVSDKPSDFNEDILPKLS